MAVRPTMGSLISRVRLLIYDPAGTSQVFADQDIQDVLDESRADVYNGVLRPQATFSGSSILFLDYLSKLGGWEDDYVLKQYLTIPVTPSNVEPIVGHFQFAESTLPPIVITGKIYDVYRAAADLLERQAAMWVLRYTMTVDGQSLQRSNVTTQLQALAKTYRMKQRAKTIYARRSDVRSTSGMSEVGLGASELDYMASGNGR